MKLNIMSAGSWRWFMLLAMSWGMLAHSTRAEIVRLDAATNSSLILAGQKQKLYLRVGLTGGDIKKVGERPPANIAIVLDKSGSMGGDKIVAARQAAIDALQRLSREDIVSVVTYDSTVSVLVPATRLTDRESVFNLIRSIEAGGSTALFAGVSKGVDELRKFIASDRVNRIILLSDGLANVGPSSPEDLAELGSSVGREGIAVTTIGVGLDYNEDLMARLAGTSNGRHYFVREASELARVFDKEFGDVMSIVAQEVQVEIECAPGVRPVRVLGRGGDITGQRTRVLFNQIYCNNERDTVLELEVPPGAEQQSRELATIHVTYDNMQTKKREELKKTVEIKFTTHEEEARKSENKDVAEAVVSLVGAEQNQLATELRDKGQKEQARQLLRSNQAYLSTNAARLGKPKLEEQAKQNKKDAENLDESKWKAQRKEMRESQNWSVYK